MPDAGLMLAGNPISLNSNASWNVLTSECFPFMSTESRKSARNNIELSLGPKQHGTI